MVNKNYTLKITQGIIFMEDCVLYLKDKISKSKSLINFEFIPTARTGDTGIGMTWEKELQISENNSKAADDNGIEHKAKRLRSNSKLTMITSTPPQSSRKIIKSHGYIDSKNRWAFKKDSPRLPFEIIKKNNEIVLVNENDVLGKWEEKDIQEKFIKKLSNLVLAKAATKKINGIEHFQYVNATYYYNFDIDKFVAEIGNTVKVCFRMHIEEDGSLRDHGTAFRIKPSDLDIFYKKKFTILDINNCLF